MWRHAPLVVVVAALCWAAAPAQAAETGEEQDICAMTEVLVAMKKLLILLSTEIRDLRQHVTACACKASNDTDDPATPPDVLAPPGPVVLEGTTPPEEANSTEIHDDYDDEGDLDLDLGFDDTFTLDVEKEEKEEDFDIEDAEENPVSEVITGLTNWWENFSPFAPKPKPEEAPEPDEGDDGDEDDQDEYEVEDDVEDADGDDDKLFPVRPQPRTTTTTTTTTTPLPYTLPPAPTRCPSPFQLLAEGCYLVVHDSRDWRSWGEAYAFCQSYRGELAAPWRLQQLQDYLSRYYSDAFWVGATYVPAKRRWEWRTGRIMTRGEWKPGQPDRNPGKKCVFLDKWSGYRANNFFCGEKYPFVCESRQG